MTPSPPEPVADIDPALLPPLSSPLSSPPPPLDSLVDRAVHLPAHCGTVAAEDLRVRLVLAADLDGGIEVRADAVDSIGQAVLQILVAARREAVARHQPYAIVDPSPAFVDRVTRCRLAGAIGLIEKDATL